MPVLWLMHILIVVVDVDGSHCFVVSQQVIVKNALQSHITGTPTLQLHPCRYGASESHDGKHQFAQAELSINYELIIGNGCVIGRWVGGLGVGVLGSGC